eukprot:4975536-Pyramimonas_sp.AAC.1
MAVTLVLLKMHGVMIIRRFGLDGGDGEVDGHPRLPGAGPAGPPRIRTNHAHRSIPIRLHQVSGVCRAQERDFGELLERGLLGQTRQEPRQRRRRGEAVRLVQAEDINWQREDGEEEEKGVRGGDERRPEPVRLPGDAIRGRLR